MTSPLVTLVTEYRVAYAEFLLSHQVELVDVLLQSTRRVPHDETQRCSSVSREVGGAEGLPRHSWRYALPQLSTGHYDVGADVGASPFNTGLLEEPQKSACVQLCVDIQRWFVVAGASAGEGRHGRQGRRGYIFSLFGDT